MAAEVARPPEIGPPCLRVLPARDNGQRRTEAGEETKTHPQQIIASCAPQSRCSRRARRPGKRQRRWRSPSRPAPLAQPVWRDEGRRRQAAERTGAREPRAQADRRLGARLPTRRHRRRPRAEVPDEMLNVEVVHLPGRGPGTCRRLAHRLQRQPPSLAAWHDVSRPIRCQLAANRQHERPNQPRTLTRGGPMNGVRSSRRRSRAMPRPERRNRYLALAKL